MPKHQTNLKLSRTIITIIGTLAIIGFISGIMSYLHRPATYKPNDPAANAILAHILLAITTLIVVIAIQAYRTRRHLPSIWLAPFSTNAYRRVTRTLVPRPFALAGVLRIIPCLLLLYVLLWEPYRAALQIVGALDPAFTANAWGGPSYLGASLAHWLDGLLLFYGSAYLLHLVMAKVPNDEKQIKPV